MTTEKAKWVEPKLETISIEETLTGIIHAPAEAAYIEGPNAGDECCGS